jgi:hypothetical protein
MVVIGRTSAKCSLIQMKNPDLEFRRASGGDFRVPGWRTRRDAGTGRLPGIFTGSDLEEVNESPSKFTIQHSSPKPDQTLDEFHVKLYLHVSGSCTDQSQRPCWVAPKPRDPISYPPLFANEPPEFDTQAVLARRIMGSERPPPLLDYR